MTSAVTGNAGAMSGLPRQADIISAAGYVRDVQQQTLHASFDHLVGA
jgi:hypothetical protein